MQRCDICKRPITAGDICRPCEIRASELRSFFQRRINAECERRKKPLEVESVKLSSLGIVDTWRDF